MEQLTHAAPNALPHVGSKTMDARRLRHGKGTYTYQYANFTYSGDWREGVRSRGALGG